MKRDRSGKSRGRTGLQHRRVRHNALVDWLL